MLASSLAPAPFSVSLPILVMREPFPPRDFLRVGVVFIIFRTGCLPDAPLPLFTSNLLFSYRVLWGNLFCASPILVPPFPSACLRDLWVRRRVYPTWGILE